MNRDKMARGKIPVEAAKAIQGGATKGLALAGTTQATATKILEELVTASSGTGGLILPVPSGPGHTVSVYNAAGATATVYPHVGGTVNGASANTGLSHVNNAAAIYKALNQTDWVSFPKVPS